jgi:DMSO reductase anchor subunit
MFTVFTTSMIYTQLKTVPRWNMPLTPVLFLLFAIAGGALVAGHAKLSGVLILLLTALQVAAWMMGDGRLPGTGSNKGTATGLGRIGPTRMLESAHTARNYILDEMVHIVGRKHSQKLRVIAALFLGVVPILLLLLTSGSTAIVFLALATHVLGVFVARWLFFAEAEHVVGLYYTRG